MGLNTLQIPASSRSTLLLCLALPAGADLEIGSGMWSEASAGFMVRTESCLKVFQRNGGRLFCRCYVC